jgi:hypothetical protein
MRRTGIKILICSLVGAACLILLWLFGFILSIGGNLIHLLLLFSLLLAVGGGVVGLILIIIDKK